MDLREKGGIKIIECTNEYTKVLVDMLLCKVRYIGRFECSP